MCVCVCSQHCCGDNESERQKRKQKEALSSIPPPFLPSCGALKILRLCQLCGRVCMCPRVRGKDASAIRACEVTVLLVRLYLRPATLGVSGPPQTHWANDQPWQLKPICESVWHQEGHLLPAL